MTPGRGGTPPRPTPAWHRVINTILRIEVVRSSTALAHSQAMPNRTRALLESVAHSDA